MSDAVLSALLKLRDNAGVIDPAAVVEAARHKSSPLHSKFTWDDSVAAKQHRLWEARRLLRVTVTMLPGIGDGEPIRAFVSLRSENGYRAMRDVLVSVAQREELLEDAKADMLAFTKKYRHLKEVADVVALMSTKLHRELQTA